MTALALLHVARRDLGLDDETYRAVLERVTGKRSARDLTEDERRAVVDEFRRQGFKPTSGGRRKALEGRFAKKLQALWIAGWNLGIVRNRDDAALLAFVKRQTGIDHTRFLHHAEDAAKAIEALKGWLTREADVDWTLRSLEAAFKQTGGYRIAVAQFRRLAPDLPAAAFHEAFLKEARAISGKVPHFMAAEADWQPVMNTFGKRIRVMKGSDGG